jgi:hypothetical protein
VTNESVRDNQIADNYEDRGRTADDEHPLTRLYKDRKTLEYRWPFEVFGKGIGSRGSGAFSDGIHRSRGVRRLADQSGHKFSLGLQLVQSLLTRPKKFIYSCARRKGSQGKRLAMRDSLIKRLSNKHLGRPGRLDRRAGVGCLCLLQPKRVENHRNVGPSGRSSASEALECKLQGSAGCQSLPQLVEAPGMHVFLRTCFSLYIEPAHQYVFDQRLRPQTQTR